MTRPADLSRHPKMSARYRDRISFGFLRGALAVVRARRLDTVAAWTRAYRLGEAARKAYDLRFDEQWKARQ